MYRVFRGKNKYIYESIVEEGEGELTEYNALSAFAHLHGYIFIFFHT